MHKLLSTLGLTIALASCESTRPHDHLVPFVPPAFAVPIAEPVHEEVGKIHPVPVDVFREMLISGLKK